MHGGAVIGYRPDKVSAGTRCNFGRVRERSPLCGFIIFSVAIAQVFSTALAGRCKERPEMVQTPIPLFARLSVLPCRGGEVFLRQLFEPLGYTVNAESHQLDEEFPDWGQSRYYTVELQHTLPLRELLSHLYVLIPVLDDEKHYWVSEQEVQKLLHHGEGWLTAHPAKQEITRRYLKRQHRLTRAALAKLAEEDQPDPDSSQESHAEEEAEVEKPISLNQQRLNAVVAALKENSAKRVIDLGCGQGSLMKVLLQDSFFEQITGVDVSYRSLEVAQERLDRLRLPKTSGTGCNCFKVR